MLHDALEKSPLHAKQQTTSMRKESFPKRIHYFDLCYFWRLCMARREIYGIYNTFSKLDMCNERCAIVVKRNEEHNTLSAAIRKHICAEEGNWIFSIIACNSVRRRWGSHCTRVIRQQLSNGIRYIIVIPRSMNKRAAKNRKSFLTIETLRK